MESKHKHLEFIQGVVNRLASDSFRLKGWAVVLVAALFVLLVGQARIEARSNRHRARAPLLMRLRIHVSHFPPGTTNSIKVLTCVWWCGRIRVVASD